jgi:hypothetical protein
MQKDYLNDVLDAIERGGVHADADFEIGFEEGEYSLRPEDDMLRPLRF